MKNVSLLLLVVLMGAACAEHAKTPLAPVAAKPASPAAPDQKATSEAPPTDQAFTQADEEAAELAKLTSSVAGYGFAVSQIKGEPGNKYFFQVTLNTNIEGLYKSNPLGKAWDKLPAEQTPILIDKFATSIPVSGKLMTGFEIGNVAQRSIFIPTSEIQKALVKLAKKTNRNLEDIHWTLHVQLMENLGWVVDAQSRGSAVFSLEESKSETLKIKGDKVEAYVWGAHYSGSKNVEAKK